VSGRGCKRRSVGKRPSIEIPEKVRRNAALTGEIGRTWLADLPQHIVELERRWAIKVEQPVQRGSEAFVAEARTSGGLDVDPDGAFAERAFDLAIPMREWGNVRHQAIFRSFAAIVAVFCLSLLASSISQFGSGR
jgi:hypothetical protein